MWTTFQLIMKMTSLHHINRTCARVDLWLRSCLQVQTSCSNIAWNCSSRGYLFVLTSQQEVIHWVVTVRPFLRKCSCAIGVSNRNRTTSRNKSRELRNKTLFKWGNRKLHWDIYTLHQFQQNCISPLKEQHEKEWGKSIYKSKHTSANYQFYFEWFMSGLALAC